MSEHYNICLLGFAPESEERIKKIVSNKQKRYEVHWVPANHERLNVVVVNAVFLATPQIKRYLSQTSAIVAYAYNSDSAVKVVATYGLQALDLRSKDETHIQAWLSYILNEEPAAAVEEVKVNKTSSAGDAKALLDVIRSKKYPVLRLNHEQNMTWIVFATGSVYINYPRENIPDIEAWTWHESYQDDIPESARKLNLDLWLFETIWQSQVSGKEIKEDTYYRLVRWPQPLGREGRTEALRLAACAQTEAVTIKMLRDKTAYPEVLVRRFLFATLEAGQLQLSNESVKRVVQTQAANSSVAPQQSAQKIEEKRGLLRRLREKFGM